MKTLSKIGNVFTLLGGVLATMALFDTALMARSAIQQCSGYASACALVVIPYCISKACKDLSE